MKRRMGYMLHVGTASILLVFITLCLVSFAVLTLVNASADYNLSKRLSDRTAGYYEAVANAEEFIADTDEALYELYLASDDEDSYMAAVVSSFGSTHITESFTINDVQSVQLELECVYPSEGEAQSTASLFVVTRYSVVTDESVYEYNENLFQNP